MKQIKVKKRCVKKMCKKIAELSGITANELLNRMHQLNTVPVDIAQICFDMNIRIKPVDFTPVEENEEFKDQVSKKGNILGIVMVHNDDLAILYRASDTQNRKRFTLAHELAHCCLHMKPEDDTHIEFRTDETSSDEREIAANKFAGELLIPEHSLRRMIDNRNTIPADLVKVLASIFAVSVNVMMSRLKELQVEVIHT